MMRRMIGAALAAILAATAPGDAAARDLPVPANKGWQHAETGLVLRATLAGLPRTRLTDAGETENDVAAQFNDAGEVNSLTIYLFHPGSSSVPIWFDRSAEALRRRDTYGGVTPATPAPVAFAPPGSTVAAGLRQVYAPRQGPYTATALAVMPLGEWLVAVRYSSQTMTPAALDAKLSAAIAEIGWPATAPPPVAAAVPVAPCPTTLRYRHARLKAPDMMQALLGATEAGMADRKAADGRATSVAATIAPLCREGGGAATFGVYRAADQTDGYLLALGDGGVTVAVYPAIALPGSPDTGGEGVTLIDLTGDHLIFPPFDALPRPEQVVDLVTTRQPVARAAADGNKVTIGVPLAK